MSVDHAELVHFEGTINQGLSIEPDDWMPGRYRQSLVRMISQHAHSEIMGMYPEANWISQAPSLRRKIALLAKIQDEAAHGLYLYSAAETLGAQRSKNESELRNGRAKYSNLMDNAATSWADVGAIAWLGDGAGIVNQVSLQDNSYGPYARALQRICQEESFHQRQGYEIIAVLAKGSAAQKEMAQSAIDRWWIPSLMMFGPPDSLSSHSEQSLRWRIKCEPNEVLRQRFVDDLVPQIVDLGLNLPDETIKWNDTRQSYDYGEIDWQHFKDLVSKGGFQRAERLEARTNAWYEGAWVREAALARNNQLRKAS